MPAQASDQRGLNAGTEVGVRGPAVTGRDSLHLQPPLASSAAPRVRRRFWRACVRRVCGAWQPRQNRSAKDRIRTRSFYWRDRRATQALRKLRLGLRYPLLTPFCVGRCRSYVVALFIYILLAHVLF